MSQINLLIIEDEDSQIDSYQSAIDQFNRKNANTIVATVKTNFADAETALKSPSFDAAIIDLKLSATEELEGRKLVESVNKKLRIPVIIYSGSISQIDDIDENVLLRKYSRDKELIKNILLEIQEIYKTGITKFLRQDGLIDKMLTEIFWEHLSDSLFDLNIEKALVRYISAHIQEFLEINGDGVFENLHPAEFYILPPIKRFLSTGDILKDKKELYYLLLTPACDIQLRLDKGNPDSKPYRNAEKILLIPLLPWNSIEGFDKVTPETGKNHDVRKKLEAYLDNRKERYHFLPPYRSIGGFFADFQSQSSIEVSEVENKKNFQRVATVTQPFLKDIIARFSQYYSRQGQPDLQKDIIQQNLRIISIGKQS